MISREDLTRLGYAWAALAGLLCGGSLLAQALPAPWLDWQPALALTEPWRAVSAAFVHWSPLHLGSNLLAAAVVGAYGWAARLPLRAALAWCVAWPLGHIGLLLRPELAHYGGLSGVLHGGVAIVCVWLLGGPRDASDPPGRRATRRAIGAAVLAGLLVKLASEQPWGPALRSSAEWDIAVAPLAHATGATAGLLCAALALAWPRTTNA